jgi:hypothetical protein
MTDPDLPGQARYGEMEEEQLKNELKEEAQRQLDYSKEDEDRLQAEMEVMPETNATPQDHTTPQE